MDILNTERLSQIKNITKVSGVPMYLPAFLGPQVNAQKIAGQLLNQGGLAVEPIQCLNPDSPNFGLRFYVAGVDALGDPSHPIYDPSIAFYGC